MIEEVQEEAIPKESVSLVDKRKSLAIRIAKICGIVLGSLLMISIILTFAFQRHLIYKPYVGREKMISPLCVKFTKDDYEVVKIDTLDNISLHGYWFKAKNNGEKAQKPTMVYFHGTSGKIVTIFFQKSIK